MFKKTLSALAVACVMLVSAAAAGTIFPAEYTDIDGVTRAGYLDEDGMTVLPFAYAQAGDFADCGLAAVENEQWQTAVIDRTGKIVIAYTDSPVSVDFSDTMVAYRYTDHSVYYATDGKRIGSYPGAVGFFEDGLLLSEMRIPGCIPMSSRMVRLLFRAATVRPVPSQTAERLCRRRTAIIRRSTPRAQCCTLCRMT